MKLIILLITVIYSLIQINVGSPNAKSIQAFKITHGTESNFALLLQFVSKPGFDFTKLSINSNSAAEVLVSPDKVEDFKVYLDDNKFKYEVTDKDVIETIKKHLKNQKKNRSKRTTSDSDILHHFPRYDEIVNYLNNIEKTNYGKIKYFSIGKSSENREILAVKISSGGTNKPSIVIDAGIHAREWISVTTALYAIKTLVENSENSNILKNVDIYIIPLLNPDGYEFSHLTNRLWRKTLSGDKNSTCFGVDANRNFDIQWGTVSASTTDPCSDVYAGPNAFSEPESIALRDFMLSQENIKVYISLHSAVNLILYPYGYTTNTPVGKFVLNCVAAKAEASIKKVRGTYYASGSTAKMLYPVSGTSYDWAFDKVGVNLSYTIELPSLKFGFLAPVSEIRPIGEETFEAIKVFVKYAEVGSCGKL